MKRALLLCAVILSLIPAQAIPSVSSDCSNRLSRENLEKYAQCTVVVNVEKPLILDAKDKEGWTALHWAAFYGKTEMVRLLLARGASVNCRDTNGRTALYLARSRGHKEVENILIHNGAELK